MKTLLLLASVVATISLPVTATSADTPAADPVSASTLLNKVSEVIACSFTLETTSAAKVSRGLADFRMIDPVSGITESSLASITDLRSAIRVLELAFPHYVVGTSVDPQSKVHVLNIIHRDLIGASPLDREVTNYTFSGTLASFGKPADKEPAFAGFQVLTEPYAPGSFIVLLNDTAPIAFQKYAGRIRPLLSAAVLQYDATKMFLWKATVQGSGQKATVSVDFYPDGGGARVAQ